MGNRIHINFTDRASAYPGVQRHTQN